MNISVVKKAKLGMSAWDVQYAPRLAWACAVYHTQWLEVACKVLQMLCTGAALRECVVGGVQAQEA